MSILHARCGWCMLDSLIYIISLMNENSTSIVRSEFEGEDTFNVLDGDSTRPQDADIAVGM